MTTRWRFRPKKNPPKKLPSLLTNYELNLNQLKCHSGVSRDVTALNVERFRLLTTVMKLFEISGTHIRHVTTLEVFRARLRTHRSAFHHAAAPSLSHDHPGSRESFQKAGDASDLRASSCACCLGGEIQSYYFALSSRRHTRPTSADCTLARGDVFCEIAFLLGDRTENVSVACQGRRVGRAATERARRASRGVVDVSHGEDTQTLTQTFPSLG